MSSLLDKAYELVEKDEFGHRRMGGAPVLLARNSAAAKAVPEADRRGRGGNSFPSNPLSFPPRPSVQFLRPSGRTQEFIPHSVAGLENGSSKVQ